MSDLTMYVVSHKKENKNYKDRQYIYVSDNTIDMPNNLPPNLNDNPDSSDKFILFNFGVNMNINLFGYLISLSCIE